MEESIIHEDVKNIAQDEKLQNESIKGDPATNSEEFKTEQTNQPAPLIKQESGLDQDQEIKRNPYLALESHPLFEPLFTKYPDLKKNLERVYMAKQNPWELREDAELAGRRPPRIMDRVEGKWTQDKADALAVTILMGLRKENEGVAEFMALALQVEQEKRNALAAEAQALKRETG